MLEMILLLIAVTLVGVIVQTIAGFGFVFFLTPALLLFFDPPVAITTTLIVASSISLMMLFRERRQREPAGLAALTLIASAIPGMLIGVWLLTTVEKHTLQVIVGLVIIAAALLQQFLSLNSTKPIAVRPSTLLSGFAAGVLNTSTSMGGPPLALWLRSRNISKHQLRDTLAVCFLGMNFAGVSVIWLSGLNNLNSKGLLIAALLIPLALVGHMAGVRLLRRIDARRYQAVVLLAIIASGLFSIAAGILG